MQKLHHSMQKVRLIASGLFYLSRLLAIPYLATALYCIICFLFPSVLVQPIEDGRRFVICYPFTQYRFLIGDDYRFYYIFEMITFIGLYGLFFWLLGNVFRTFRSQKLFTALGVKRLKFFTCSTFSARFPF